MKPEEVAAAVQSRYPAVFVEGIGDVDLRIPDRETCAALQDRYWTEALRYAKRGKKPATEHVVAYQRHCRRLEEDAIIAATGLDEATAGVLVGDLRTEASLLMKTCLELCGLIAHVLELAAVEEQVMAEVARAVKEDEDDDAEAAAG